MALGLRVVLLGAALGVMLQASCNDSDIGKSCPGLEVPSADTLQGEGTQAATWQEVVEVRGAFPCDSAVCVATPWSGSFCSAKCSSNDACPSAFECRSLVGSEDGAQRYCVWRTCRNADDCGDYDKYRCSTIAQLSTEASPYGLCAPR